MVELIHTCCGTFWETTRECEVYIDLNGFGKELNDGGTDLAHH